MSRKTNHSEKKKLMFIISSLTFGGAEKQTISLINGLDREVFELRMIYIKKAESLLSTIDLSPSEVICLDKKKKIDYLAIKKLSLIIKEFCPDIVVCVNPYPLTYLKLGVFRTSCSAKIVTILHSTRMRDFYNRFLVKYFYRFMINSTDKVVFVCKNQMDYWLKKCGIKGAICSSIYNGIDESLFSMRNISEVSATRSALGIRENEFIITICATLRIEKQHHILINAGKVILDLGVPIRILLVGDGPERGEIEKCVQESGMETRTTFTGFQKDVRPYIAVADVFALVSSTETFSMAILEAMALSKVIVAPDVGGVSEQIKNGENGYLFTQGNAKELANRLYQIYQDQSQEKMGKASHRMVIQNFTEQKMLKQYSALFVQL